LKLLIAFSIFFLISCSVNEEKEAPLVKWRPVVVPDQVGLPITPTADFEERNIKLVFLTEDEMKNLPQFGWSAAWHESVEKGFGGLATGFESDAVTCVVRVMKPTGMDDYAFFYSLGHEIYHCFYGDYHHGN